MMRARVLAVLGVAVLWLALRLIFWNGYVGADDFLYGRYAAQLHRPPIDHREFRLAAVLLMRVSFLIFGRNEIAACLPTLASSLLLLAAVAWSVNFPRELSGRSQAAVLLAATMPLDVAMATYPGAPMIAAGCMAWGMALLLRGTGRGKHAGAVLLAIGFWTHEVMLFLAGAVCLAALWQDRRRYGPAVLTCIAAGVGVIAIEALLFSAWMGEPLARYRLAANVTLQATDLHSRFGGDVVLFFLWSIGLLLASEHFGFDFLFVALAGLFCWKRLDTQQRILLAALLAYWLWLGYGTQVPWAYRPRTRGMHYYLPFTFIFAVLWPPLCERVFAAMAARKKRRPLMHRPKRSAIPAQAANASADAPRQTSSPFVRRSDLLGTGPIRERCARILVLTLAVHVMLLSIGGRWGKSVDVSRRLYRYAEQHQDQMFVTDADSWNAMYVINGYRPPPNVVVVGGPAVLERLLPNREPPAAPRLRFEPVRVTACLVNYDEAQQGVAASFAELVKRRNRRIVYRVPPEYRPILQPVAGWIGPRGWALQSRGGVVVAIDPVLVGGGKR